MPKAGQKGATDEDVMEYRRCICLEQLGGVIKQGADNWGSESFLQAAKFHRIQSQKQHL